MSPPSAPSWLSLTFSPMCPAGCHHQLLVLGSSMGQSGHSHYQREHEGSEEDTLCLVRGEGVGILAASTGNQKFVGFSKDLFYYLFTCII